MSEQKVKRLFITELIGLEKQIEIFNKTVDFPIIYLGKSQVSFLANKLITILPLEEYENDESDQQDSVVNDAQEFIWEAFLYSDLVLIAADSLIYLKIIKAVEIWKKSFRWSIFQIPITNSSLFLPKNLFSYKEPARDDEWIKYYQRLIPLVDMIDSSRPAKKRITNDSIPQNELEENAKYPTSIVPNVQGEN